MKVRVISRLGGLVVAALALGGCTGGSAVQQEADKYRWDPSPEVDTLTERPDDMLNTIAITNDTNLRMLNEDLGRFWLFERPSRLSPLPIPR